MVVFFFLMEKVVPDIKTYKMTFPQASWGKQTWLKHMVFIALLFAVCNREMVGDPKYHYNIIYIIMESLWILIIGIDNGILLTV